MEVASDNTMLTRKIQLQRDQLVINLPRQICDDFGWRKGDVLRIFVVARGIIQMEKMTVQKSRYRPQKSQGGEVIYKAENGERGNN